MGVWDVRDRGRFAQEQPRAVRRRRARPRARCARTVANSPKGHAAAYEWICEVADGERCLGIEATGGFAYVFSLLLDSYGECVFDVPPNQTDRERGRQTTRSKSDEKDALAIARITLR
jgi:transposase